jgi:hypothetical protein
MSNFGGQSLPSLESSNLDSGRGDHVLKPGAGMIMRPSWTKSDPTVIRPFPCFEGNTFQPTRYSENEYSKWFFECTMVTSFGNPQKSWIAYDPEDRNYEVRSNPAVMVYDLAAQVSNGKVRGPQEWALAIKGGQGKSAAVSKPDRTLLIRCAMYEYKGEPKQPVDGLAPNHQTVYMLLKKSAWQSMVRELSVVKPGVSSDNVNQKFESGDVVALKDGAFLVFYEIGMIPRGYDAPRSAPPVAYGKSKPIGYDCIISKNYRGMPATFTDSEIEMIAKRVANPIRTQLNFPTDEEQVRYVVDSMRGTPAHAGMVVHALRDRYERYLPTDFVNYGNEFLRQVGLMAAMVSNPGYAQPVLPTYQPVAPQPSWNNPVAPQPVAAPAQVQAQVPAFAYTAAQAPIAEANAAANLNKEELQAQLKELRAKLGTPEPR